MLILGIDPGTLHCGFGLVRAQEAMTVVEYGVWDLPDKLSLSERLHILGDQLKGLISHYRPDRAVVEKIFLGKNADSAFKLGQARGVVLLELSRAHVMLKEYSTREVKKGLTGNGNSTKEQVNLWVQSFLRIGPISSLDASDALALAIHHATRMEVEARLLRCV